MMLSEEGAYLLRTATQHIPTIRSYSTTPQYKNTCVATATQTTVCLVFLAIDANLTATTIDMKFERKL